MMNLLSYKVIHVRPNSSRKFKMAAITTIFNNVIVPRVQKGCCRAMMKMWKLSRTDVCDCEERQTMSHLMTCVDAPNCPWADLAIPTIAGVNCAKHWEESI